MFTDQLWIISALVFGAGLLAAQSLYSLVYRSRKERKIINRRLALSAQLENPDDVFESLRRERGFALALNIPGLDSFDRFVTQTGLNLTLGQVVLWLLALGACIYLPLWLLLDLGLIALPVAFVGAVLVGLLFLRMARTRRIR